MTLVDDFITKGRTLFAAACLVQEAYPQAVVRAFALVRTIGLITDVEKLVEPCEGVVSYDDSISDVARKP
jgi:adenine/guanine phosphoribosyltransferase-like PRPP-binding protein